MTQLSQSVELDIQDGIAVVSINNPPVNALSFHVRDGLLAGINEAEELEEVRATLLICKGNTYIAGADIREFGQKPQGAHLFDVHDALEQARKPVVSAIHGTAFGGGLETALCCHFRVAVESAQFGFPEVKLGLLPGAGGTQRLPRLIGVTEALQMMVSGSPIDARQALNNGLIDEIVDDLLPGAIRFTKKVVEEGQTLRRIRDLDEKLDSARQDEELFARFRKSIARKARGFVAPEAIIRCVEDSLNMPYDEAIAKERERFMELVKSPESAAQRYYFFAERQASKVPDLPKETPKLPVKKVGVIGAGTMGGGISMNFLSAGFPVTLVEHTQDALDRGLATTRKNYERTAKRGAITAEQVEANMARLTPSLSLEDLSDCDLIIEAVFELLDIKKTVFQKIDAIAKPEAILATNTSALDINEIAAMTKRPESVLGTHFFSPANIMRLCEVVRAEKTSDEVLATVMGLTKKIGKVPVVSGVCHGFIGNRMLFVRGHQCDKMIFDGAMPWDIDRVIFDYGMPMGPFAMMDLAGLDIGWDPDNSDPENVLRDKLCELGRRGQKTGKGYYNYDPETREKSEEPEVEAIIREFSDKRGITRRKFSDEEILQRALYPMVNEGAKILEEGISNRPSDIDVVWVNGYGWPVYRGGPMFWADTIGLEKIVAKLSEFREVDQDSFWTPAPLLQKLVSEGKKFADLN